MLLNATLVAASLPATAPIEKAGFVGAACSHTKECGPKGEGLEDHLLWPGEEVGIWMLCQGSKTWKISLKLAAEETHYEPPHEASHLSQGAIAGIIIGCIIGGLLLFGFLFIYWRRTYSREKLAPEQ